MEGDNVKALAEAFEVFTRTTQSLEESYRLLDGRAKDLGERLAAKNRELAITNDYLSSILESMSDGVIAVDRDGVITSFNRSASHILGYSSVESVGCAFKALFNRDFCAGAAMVSTTLLAKGGRGVSISERDAPIADRHDVQSGMVKVFQDLTELEALRERVRHMDRLAAVGEMAATVAHEIRNPLGGIRGFASLLKRDIAPDDGRARLVDKILVGVKNLDRVVSELLEFTRPLELVLKPVTCVDVVEAALAYIDADARPVRIVNGVSPTLRVMADADRMRQVILNILLNAVQSIEGEGGVKISARLAGGAVVLTVADTGAGISAEHLERIFTPFFTTKEKGSGLGLAIAAKIVEGHGGTLRVKSKVGKGTTFYIQLPRAE